MGLNISYIQYIIKLHHRQLTCRHTQLRPKGLKCVKRDQSSKLHFLRLYKLNTGEWCCILYWNSQVSVWLVRCNIRIRVHRARWICTWPAADLFPSNHFLLHIQVCLTRSDSRFSKVIQTASPNTPSLSFWGILKKQQQQKTSIYGINNLCNLFDRIGLFPVSRSPCFFVTLSVNLQSDCQLSPLPSLTILIAVMAQTSWIGRVFKVVAALANVVYRLLM